MPKTKKKVDIDTTEKSYPYYVFLESDGEKCATRGDTVLEALNLLAPQVIKSRYLLRVTKGEKTSQMYVYPAKLRKILASEVWRQILDKRFTQALL